MLPKKENRLSVSGLPDQVYIHTGDGATARLVFSEVASRLVKVMSNETNNPYIPPSTPVAPVGEPEKSWPVRIFCGVSALLCLSVLVEREYNGISLTRISTLVIGYAIFQLTHAAARGRWFSFQPYRR